MGVGVGPGVGVGVGAGVGVGVGFGFGLLLLGTTTMVMLWAGTLSDRLVPPTETSPSRLIELAEVSCHTEALPAGVKLPSESAPAWSRRAPC